MKKILMIIGVIAIVGVVSAGVGGAGTIEFEDMPEEYIYNVSYASTVNFGDYWEGVTFGPDATVLDKGYNGYNYTGYPPYSGDAVLFSFGTPSITAKFDNSVDFVSMYYTSVSDFYLEAYDSSNTLINSVLGGSNYNNNSYIKITSSSYNIAYVTMHDSGNYFTIDDFTAEFVSGNPTNPVPEPSTILLMGTGLFGLVGYSRKRFSKKS